MTQKGRAEVSNRSLRAQQRAIEENLERMTIWYASASGGMVPEALAVDKKTYRGKVLRWLEPLLPGEENPILIEEQLGDNWTLRLEASKPEIMVFVPS